MKNSPLIKGIIIMIASSFFTCFGQLLWKLSSIQNNFLFIVFGFVLYGLGALTMIIAMRFGDLSKLHPMLSFGFVLSLILGSMILGEPITTTKVLGTILIIVGLMFLSCSGKTKAQP